MIAIWAEEAISKYDTLTYYAIIVVKALSITVTVKSWPRRGVDANEQIRFFICDAFVDTQCDFNCDTLTPTEKPSLP